MKSKNNTAGMINKKLRSNAGESIAETLVALLISALALVMLAGAASRIVTSSRSKLNTYYNGNEVLVRLDLTDAPDDRAINEGSGTITLSAGSTVVDTKAIDYFENYAFEKNKVVAYKLKTPAAPAP